MTHYPRIAALGSPSKLRQHLAHLGLDLPVDDAPADGDGLPLAQSLDLGGGIVLGNRFVVQPMEGWDGTAEGLPSELTRRRWRNFGRSGAAWIWGGEAVAVRGDGRANPHQLLLDETTVGALEQLRLEALRGARDAGLPAPFIGLQLTHSGRWSRTQDGRGAPRIAFRHPLLDPRAGVTTDDAVLSDAEVDDLVARFAEAARLTREAGFDFVDLKHCHGYLLHEFLAARAREGRFGGPTLAHRTRLLHTLLDAMRVAAPGLPIGVRLSVFDGVPHRADGIDANGHLGPGRPEPHERPYHFGFGVDVDAGEKPVLDEAHALIADLLGRGVHWINVTAGSPYYVPHLQRPAAFPPSDGYSPPEDPLCGVFRLLDAARRVKRAAPGAVVVSTGWTYLQEYIPHVAAACVRRGWFDAVGLGRMMLAYPELPSDLLAGRQPDRRRLCRTFSDCTTAPRQGLVSGCYPLDPFYRARPERQQVEAMKQSMRKPG